MDGVGVGGGDHRQSTGLLAGGQAAQSMIKLEIFRLGNFPVKD